MKYQSKTLGNGKIKPKSIVKDITVVIPTLGRPILEECLNWILIGSVWPAQITVVDQGSNPKIANWLGKLQTIGIQTLHLPSSQRGRASALNRGLVQLKTRFVAITDDDCFVDKCWLENMLKRLGENPNSITTGRVDPAGDKEVMAVVTRQHSIVYRRPGLKFDAMSGGNMGTSKEVIERVGFFDEDPRLRCAEDGEWAYRALRSGVPIIYAPEVSVRHYGWRDEPQRIIQYKTYALSHGAFYGKYLRKGDWFIAIRTVIHYLRVLKRWLLGRITGKRELALNGRAYAIGLMPGIIRGMRIGSSNER